MSYQVVGITDFGREKLIRFDYKTNAKDFAMRAANQVQFGVAYEVVNEKTGILAGTARRSGPGKMVEWAESVKPTPREVL